MNKEKVKIYSKKIIDSNYFLVSIFFILIFFLFFNILSFINGNVIDSYWINNGICIGEKYSFLGFFSIFFGWIGGTLGTIGTVLLVRKTKNSLLLILIGLIFSMIDQMIIGVFFTLLTYMITFGLFITMIFKKGEDDHKEIKFLEILTLSLVFILWIIFGFLFYSLILPKSTITIYNSLDVVASSIVIPSWWIILRNKNIGFLGFIVNDALYIIMFSVIGLYVVTVSFFVYLTINILSINSY